MTVEQKRGLPVLLSFLGIIFLLASFFFVDLDHDYRRERLTALKSSSFLLGEWIKDSFTASGYVLQNMVSHISFEDSEYPPQNIRLYARERDHIDLVRLSFPHARKAGFIDSNGILTYSVFHDGEDMSTLPFYEELRSFPSESFHISNAFTNRDGADVVSHSLRYDDDETGRSGAAILMVDLAFFGEWLERLDEESSHTISIIDEKGSLLAGTLPSLGGKALVPRELADIADSSEDSGFQIRHTGGADRGRSRSYALRRIEGLPFYIVIADPASVPLKELAFPFFMVLLGLCIMTSLGIMAYRSYLKQISLNHRLEQTGLELSTILENSMVGIVLLDSTLHIIRANQSFAHIFGFDSPEELQGRDIVDFHVDEQSARRLGEIYDRGYPEKGIIRMEYEFRKKNGETLWGSVVGKAVESHVSADPSRNILWIIDDISERRRDRLELERAHRELEIFFNNSLIGIAVLRGGRVVHKVNQRMADILKYRSPEEIEGRSVEDFHISHENFEEFGARFYDSLIQRDVIQVEYPFRAADGSKVWLSTSGRALDPDEPPDPAKGVLWIMEDISERRAAEQKLREMAATDVLTGTANRRSFMEGAEREFAIYLRHRRPLTTVMLDIDHFKAVNDRYGHGIGDKAIVLAVDICRKSLRSGDLFGRIGGEEFALVLPDTNGNAAVLVAERIRTMIEEETRERDDGIPPFTISMGLAEASDRDKRFELLLQRADNALYRAKENGRNRICRL
jgi:diguanylate cyclase (GGDEF)-like protein/PAS domain S-box-containing protein